MRVLPLFATLLIGACATSAFAQQLNERFVNFGSRDGLYDKVVYNCTQDKQGYMWFATATGLYRYDGHHFRHIRSPLDKAGSNIANILQAIRTDKSGMLWLGSFTTLQWYDPVANRFWQPDLTQPELKKMAASYFYNFSEGRYTWCSTARNYVYRFNPRDSSFLSLASAYPPGASTTSLNTVEADGYLFDMHPEAIYVFDLEGKYVRTVYHTAGDITNGVYVRSENSIYLTTYESGVLRYHIASQTLTPAFAFAPQLLRNFLYCIVRDDDGKFYLGTGAFSTVDPGRKELRQFFTGDKRNDYSFQASKVVSIFIDCEKNKWFCGHEGLSLMPWQNSQVRSVLLRDEVTGNITEPLGAYEEPRSGDILIPNTSSAGLQVIGARTEKVITVVNPAQRDPLKRRITGLIIAPDSSVYASDDTHFFRYDPAGRTLIPFLLKDQYGQPLRLMARHVTDRAGRIFIGSLNNGFYRWDYSSNRLWHFNKWEVAGKDSATDDNQLMPCIADHRQHIWFTSSNGIYEYRSQDDRFYHHTPPADAGIPEMGETEYIAEDMNGHIWVATENNGLYEFYTADGKEVWKNYTVNSGIGLPTDFIRKIRLNPADGYLWMNNTAGLLKFDPVRRQVVGILAAQHGMFGEGQGYSFSITADNRLVQLYYGAASIVDLNTYRLNTVRPVVQFSSVKVLNEEQLYTHPPGNGILMLGHNQNFLQLEFTALVFNNANQNRYAYRLDGADKDWINSGSVNSVSYAALPPGRYVFRVKAANNDGFWGPEAILAFRIQAPFYARWWFIALCALTAAAGIYAWNRFRVRQARNEEALKASFRQQIAETEMKALRAQMNPHFIFNSLNSIQKFILKNRQFEASQYLTSFSRLMRLILDHSNQGTVLLSSELEMLKLYIEMESLRFDQQFDYEIIVDETLRPDFVEIPSILIQPYVENAIWHGLLHKMSKGKLTLTFKGESGHHLMATVEDNGIGRAKAAELKSKQVLKKKSYGMQITENRIALMNRLQEMRTTVEVIDLRDADGAPAGTRVVLRIPLKKIVS